MNSSHQIILIDKPQHITSFGVVAQVRHALGTHFGKKVKVGHTGTLDPFATGLLILVSGDMCKSAGDFSKKDKTYEATIFLGKTSSTGDVEGELSAVSARQPTIQEIEAQLPNFVGNITQIPPQFSAIKINGRRAYDAARNGEVVDIPARQITVHSLEIIAYTYPHLQIRAHVSSGTYIRTLAEDIGNSLGVGGFCETLRRTSIAEFSIANAESLTDFMKKFGKDFFDTVELQSGKTRAKISTNGAWLEKLYDEDGDILFGKKMLRYPSGETKNRGGSHLCAPNFGTDFETELAQHGFARTKKWKITEYTKESVTLSLDMSSDGISKKYQTIDFSVRYELSEKNITMRFFCKNSGDGPVRISPGFHPYFALGKNETIVKINALPYGIHDISGTKWQRKTRTMSIQTELRKITMHTKNLDQWAIWSDARAPYICVEPTYAGEDFAQETPQKKCLLVAGEEKNYSLDISWGVSQ